MAIGKVEKLKYIEKSDRSRSRFLTTDTENTPQIRREPTARRGLRRATARDQARQQSTVIQKDQPGSIFVVKTNTVNTLYFLTELEKGESIRDMIISHWSSSSTDAVISLYWSVSPPSEIEVTVLAGRISAQTKGNFARLLTIDMPHSTTLSLADNHIINSFGNLDRNIYFYAVSSQQYTQWTIIK